MLLTSHHTAPSSPDDAVLQRSECNLDLAASRKGTSNSCKPDQSVPAGVEQRGCEAVTHAAADRPPAVLDQWGGVDLSELQRNLNPKPPHTKPRRSDQVTMKLRDDCKARAVLDKARLVRWPNSDHAAKLGIPGSAAAAPGCCSSADARHLDYICSSSRHAMRTCRAPAPVDPCEHL